MDDKDIDKTAFVTHPGLLKYTWILFKLQNASTIFQRAIDIILASVKWKHAIIYIEDIIIFSRSRENNVLHIEEVLPMLRDAGMIFKLKKCFSFTKKLTIWGTWLPQECYK